MLVALLLAPSTLRAQDVPPDADWRTIATEHFRVTFSPGLEPVARHTADRAEVAYARLAEQLTDPPDGRVDIVVADHFDTTAGFARPFPSNRIVFHARPPVGDLALGFYNDWVDLVVTHELVHVFHLDRTGSVGEIVRSVLGRMPWTWPLFPVIGTPGWSTEGLATYFESRLTGAGRVHGTYHEMIVRTAALEGAFPDIDGAEGLGPSWPGGQSAYVFGSLFIDHLAREHGPELPRRIVDETAGALIPPPLWFDDVADDATGRSFTDAWRAWRTDLENRYGALADSLRASGLTEPERLTRDGRRIAMPRISPDGRYVAFAASDGRDDPDTRLLDTRTGGVRTLAERGQVPGEFGPAAWLADGRGLVLAQLRFEDAYRARLDLFRLGLDGNERRLTRAARLSGPDVAPDGRRAVAVQTRPGTNRLVTVDLESGEIRPLTDAGADRHWALPRWSPDGSRIAAVRWSDGGYHDIVVLDTVGSVVAEVTRDRAMDSAPTWSPDGRYVLFWSDRTGIANLYAFDTGGSEERISDSGSGSAIGADHRASSGVGVASGLDTGASSSGADRLRQVTNVLGGAFDPAVSPDGRWIYFVGYHATGFDLERIPFSPETWREASPLRPEVAGAVDGAGDRAADHPGDDGAAGAVPAATHGSTTGRRTEGVGRQAPAAAPVTAPAEPYSAWRTLLPRFWSPVASSGEVGTFVGAFTAGEDLVGRHSYDVEAAFAPEHRRVRASAAYTYAGLGSPLLNVGLSQDWDHVGIVTAGERAIDVHGRERTAELSATLLRRRLRSAAALTFGGEWIDERSFLQDAPDLRLTDPADRLLGAFARVGFGNYRVHPYSISRENGVALSLGALRRWDRGVFTDGDGRVHDGSYSQVHGRFALYADLPLVGFADHVLAARVAGLRRSGRGAPLSSVGGASGSASGLPGDFVDGSRLFLPVRGYPEGYRRGTRAWTASTEYRFPVALIERGFRLWPVFLDRLSGAVFVDAGDAGCDSIDAERLPDSCADRSPFVGAGAELSLDVSFGFAASVRFRSGVAWPLSLDGDRRPVYYIRLGPSF